MDILKKMFSNTDEEKSQSESKLHRDEFRKPAWYEEDETDDELFGKATNPFQILTNPIEIQRHFERQMQEMLKSMSIMEDNREIFDGNFKDEYLKPGYESNIIKEFQKQFGEDESDEFFRTKPDEMHSLLQRVTPELDTLLTKTMSPEPSFLNSREIKKLSDKEKILGLIHGTITNEEEKTPKVIKKRDPNVPKFSPHFGGVFEGSYQGPKMFGQSVVTHTILKPDGTYETKRIVKDSEGNVKTTITRTKEGKSETITTYGDGKNTASKTEPGIMALKKPSGSLLASDRNIFISKKGYALPMNLW